MNLQRAILITFLGSYLVNTVVSVIVYMIPGALTDTRSGFANPYYLLFLAASVVVIGLLTWWYLKGSPRSGALSAGAIFGVVGVVVVILTTLISGISNAWFQAGSFDSIVNVVKSFAPLFTSVQTLVLVLEWVVPAAVVGWLTQRKVSSMGSM